MNFENKTPEWTKEGIEPSDELKSKGFSPGYKPPAAFFNWFWNAVSKNLAEIKAKLANVDSTPDSEKTVKRALTAGTADKTAQKMTVQLNGGTTEGTNKFTFNGSTAKSVNITKGSIGLGKVDNTADSEKSVNYAATAGSADAVAWSKVTNKPSTFPPATHTHTKADIGLGNVDNTADANKSVNFASTAGSANKTKSAMTVRLNGGTTEGTNQYTFDGSAAKSVNITPASIGAAAASHTHSVSNTGAFSGIQAADFDYVRFTDGTQMCWGSSSIRYGESIFITFPQAFLNTPSVTATYTEGSDMNVYYSATRTATAATFHKYKISGTSVAGATYAFCWTAVGYWK